MRTLPISKVKDKLNEYVDSVAITHEQLTITKNGSPAAVLIGADEWESIQETLFWLSQPGIREAIAEAEDDIAAGRSHGEDEIRAEFGVPTRDNMSQASWLMTSSSAARRDARCTTSRPESSKPSSSSRSGT
ncbi:MAG: prevent-host-death family protein [Pseudonocardiales bacterium]|nr:MAG: prevent-host-death family protein [Pseudonocardiales bacterium]